MSRRSLRPGDAERGLTLVELMIVVAVLVPLLAMIAQTSTVVNRTVESNDRGAEVFEASRKALQRMGKFLRPAKLSTLQESAVDADIVALRATTVGEWIDPVDLEARPGIRFVAAEGFLSMNANLSTSPRELLFVRDAGELENGVDDDGDGMVDEGRIMALYEGTRLVMAEGIEACTFTTDGRMIRVTVRCARGDQHDNVYRATMSQSFFVRNN